MARDVADVVLDLPEVTSVQTHAGTRRALQLQRPRAALLPARPNRNWARWQINLTAKADRDRASHAIALDLRAAAGCA